MNTGKKLSKYLSQLYFQSKVIGFANSFICKYDSNIIKDNEQEIKVLPNDKYNFYNSVPLCNILSISAHEPLWHMARIKAKDVSKKTENSNLKLGVCLF